MFYALQTQETVQPPRLSATHRRSVLRGPASETQSLNYQKITVVLRSRSTLLYTQTSPIESSGIPPGLSFCPTEYPSCPTSPSDRAATQAVPISPKVGTARSMRSWRRKPKNGLREIWKKQMIRALESANAGGVIGHLTNASKELL